MRLLLIDHSPAYRETLAEALTDVLGATVTEVASDTEGLDALEAGEPFDCVLVDLHIPRGGGLSLVRELHTRGGPPVVVMTAHERPTDREQADEAGAAGYADKTRGLHPLIEAIHDATGRAGL